MTEGLEYRLGMTDGVAALLYTLRTQGAEAAIARGEALLADLAVD